MLASDIEKIDIDIHSTALEIDILLASHPPNFYPAPTFYLVAPFLTLQAQSLTIAVVLFKHGTYDNVTRSSLSLKHVKYILILEGASGCRSMNLKSWTFYEVCCIFVVASFHRIIFAEKHYVVLIHSSVLF